MARGEQCCLAVPITKMPVGTEESASVAVALRLSHVSTVETSPQGLLSGSDVEAMISENQDLTAREQLTSLLSEVSAIFDIDDCAFAVAQRVRHSSDIGVDKRLRQMKCRVS